MIVADRRSNNFLKAHNSTVSTTSCVSVLVDAYMCLWAAIRTGHSKSDAESDGKSDAESDGKSSVSTNRESYAYAHGKWIARVSHYFQSNQSRRRQPDAVGSRCNRRHSSSANDRLLLHNQEDVVVAGVTRLAY